MSDAPDTTSKWADGTDNHPPSPQRRPTRGAVSPRRQQPDQEVGATPMDVLAPPPLSAVGQPSFPFAAPSTPIETREVQWVKASHPLAEVCAAYGITLSGRGRTRMGRCPFHADDTPSLCVYTDTESFYCFGCGASGDVITLIERLEDVGFREALERLGATPSSPPARAPKEARSLSFGAQTKARETVTSMKPPQRQSLPLERSQPAAEGSQGVPHSQHMHGATHRSPAVARAGAQVSSAAVQRTEDAWDPRALADLPPMYAFVLTAAAAIYMSTLARSPRVVAYLRERGVAPHVAMRARLGYADGVTLPRFLRHDPHLLTAAQAVGLIDRAGGERLRGRLVFPEFRQGVCLWMLARLVPSRAYRPLRAPARPLATGAHSPDDSDAASAGPTAAAREASVPAGRMHMPAPKYLGLALPKPLLGRGLNTAAAETPGKRDPSVAVPQASGEASGGVLVVEGFFDLLTVLGWRIPLTCVALAGTRPSAAGVDELCELAHGQPIWLGHDADAAGDEGAKQLAVLLERSGHAGPVRRLMPPLEAKDFSELARRPGGRAALLSALAGESTRCQDGTIGSSEGRDR